MALMGVNPTRMELKRLKGRLKTAQRGYKLLKDKTDEMIRQFVVIARSNKQLREEVEFELGEALKSFMLARGLMSDFAVDEAVMMPSRTLSLVCSKRNLMSVSVPVIELKSSSSDQLFPYSFANVTSQLDNSINTLNKLMLKLLELAQVEKTCNMMAEEIEKNKRRVNALENVIIPQMTETIKFIRMKLDESERGALIRLMKVKEMIEKRDSK